MVRQRGYSLMEMVVALAIFSVLLLVAVSLENQMLRFERSMRTRFMIHPEEMAVIARVRKDVLDAQGYAVSAGPYVQSPTSLILSELTPENIQQQVVYDFAEQGLVRRIIYQQNEKIGEWVGRGLPQFQVSSFTMPNDEVAVRLYGFDRKGTLIVDQILLPRRKS
jgi:prepilin-type N-terminal cleavage/methylation domain-containing protein